MNNEYQENLENVLEKYGRDITKSAKDGKTDWLWYCCTNAC